MTFHDEVEHDMEVIAYKSAKHLVIWLKTIAPVHGMELAQDLITLAKDMNWPIENTDQVGELIK
jgi:hypothetical protein